MLVGLLCAKKKQKKTINLGGKHSHSLILTTNFYFCTVASCLINASATLMAVLLVLEFIFLDAVSVSFIVCLSLQGLDCTPAQEVKEKEET